MIGHDYFSSNTSMVNIIGNAVLLANTTGTVNVLGYTQYADVTGEVARTNTAITTRASALGRTVAFVSPLTDYTLLDSRLPGNHVLLIYEMESGGSGSTIGATWSATLTSFVNSGGVVIACNYFDTSWQIMNSSGLLSITSQASATSSSINVVGTTDPIAAGVATPYTGLSGSSQYVTSETGIVTQVSGGNPVVIHKQFVVSGCADGTTEVTWASNVVGCRGPTTNWGAYDASISTYCSPGWIMAQSWIVNALLVSPAYTDDVKYAYDGEGCNGHDYFATRYDSYAQTRSACGWLSSHHWSLGSGGYTTGIVDGVVCEYP